MTGLFSDQPTAGLAAASVLTRQTKCVYYSFIKEVCDWLKDSYCIMFYVVTYFHMQNRIKVEVSEDCSTSLEVLCNQQKCYINTGSLCLTKSMFPSCNEHVHGHHDSAICSESKFTVKEQIPFFYIQETLSNKFFGNSFPSEGCCDDLRHAHDSGINDFPTQEHNVQRWSQTELQVFIIMRGMCQSLLRPFITPPHPPLKQTSQHCLTNYTSANMTMGEENNTENSNRRCCLCFLIQRDCRGEAPNYNLYLMGITFIRLAVLLFIVNLLSTILFPLPAQVACANPDSRIPIYTAV